MVALRMPVVHKAITLTIDCIYCTTCIFELSSPPPPVIPAPLPLQDALPKLPDVFVLCYI